VVLAVSEEWAASEEWAVLAASVESVESVA